MITVERKVDFSRARRGRKQIHGGCDRSKQMQDGAEAPAISTGRVPRVSRLMALAIRFDQLIRDGVVTDQAELARLGHVTRARLTQIMNLLNWRRTSRRSCCSLLRQRLDEPPCRSMTCGRSPQSRTGQNSVNCGVHIDRHPWIPMRRDAAPVYL